MAQTLVGIPPHCVGPARTWDVHLHPLWIFPGECPDDVVLALLFHGDDEEGVTYAGVIAVIVALPCRVLHE